MSELNQGLSAGVALEEARHPLAEPMEALQGFMGHIGSKLRSGYEAVLEVPRNAKTYAAIGATAFTLFTLAHAETATASSEPVAGENVPTLTDGTILSAMPEAGASSATTSSLKSDCVSAELVPPTVINTHDNPTEMFAPGRLGQSIPVHTEVQPIPQECDGVFKRIIKATVKMQYYKNLKRMIKMGGFMYTSDAGGSAGAILSENSHTTVDNYHCATPGTSHVELNMQNTVKNKANGHVAARGPVHTRFIEVQGHGFGC